MLIMSRISKLKENEEVVVVDAACGMRQPDFSS
jgi:hypothetical protein